MIGSKGQRTTESTAVFYKLYFFSPFFLPSADNGNTACRKPCLPATAVFFQCRVSCSVTKSQIAQNSPCKLSKAFSQGCHSKALTRLPQQSFQSGQSQQSFQSRWPQQSFQSRMSGFLLFTGCYASMGVNVKIEYTWIIHYGPMNDTEVSKSSLSN